MGLDSDSGGDFLASRALVGGLFDNTAKKSRDQVKGNQQLWNSLETPDLEWKDYAPELFSSEDAEFSLTEEDPALRGAQLSVLEKLAGLSSEGMTPEDEYNFFKARQEGEGVAKRGTEAAIQNANARGVGGSGLEFAMREIANQGGADRAQEAGLATAADAAKQRALYTQAYGDAVSGVRGQDANVNKANTDVINQFNKANTVQRNQTQNLNTQTRNDAQQYNNQGDINTQQQNFNNQVTKMGGQSGANMQMANAYAAQNASRTAARNQDMKDFASIMSMVGGGG